jgi:hypothetical protein
MRHIQLLAQSGSLGARTTIVRTTHAAARDAPDWGHLAYHLGGDRFAARIKSGRVL